MTRGLRLGRKLRDLGILDRRRLQQGLERQAATGERLGEALVALNLVEEARLLPILADHLGVQPAALPLTADREILARLPAELPRERGVLPVGRQGRAVLLAMVDPLDLAVLEEVQFRLGAPVRPRLTTKAAVVSALAGSRASERAGGVVSAVDRILTSAVTAGASDVHVEPRSDGVRIRWRIDGILREMSDPPDVPGTTALSRIKVMAGMDIAVRRRPQDGGFSFNPPSGGSWAVRVSTLPLEMGEKAVLRILATDRAPVDLEATGLVGEDLRRVRAMLGRQGGVILVAGPTGSGKSSTLAAAVGELDREGQNVVSLEDPVEYRLSGVSQVEVRPRAGLTFASALRAVLRQDPDVILVGEIRDRETAEIAMAAAVTGHLVLSTIHTLDGPSGIGRLLHMGVPRYLVAAGLAGIVAQRLVRRLCPGCGGHPDGCTRCPDGYRGRTGIFQVLRVSEGLREEILRGAGTPALRRRARAEGMGSMGSDARRKVADGLTSPHEVGRVLQGEAEEALPCGRCRNGVPLGARACPHCGLPRGRTCRCGEDLESRWRFCPSCRRPAPPPPDEAPSE